MPSQIKNTSQSNSHRRRTAIHQPTDRCEERRRKSCPDFSQKRNAAKRATKSILLQKIERTKRKIEWIDKLIELEGDRKKIRTLINKKNSSFDQAEKTPPREERFKYSIPSPAYNQLQSIYLKRHMDRSIPGSKILNRAEFRNRFSRTKAQKGVLTPKIKEEPPLPKRI